MSDRFVSADMAAAMSGRTVRTVRRWAAAGKVRTQRTESGHMSYSVRDLERLTDTSDTARTPVRVEETDAMALLREMSQQNVQLARRIGQLEQQVEQLQAENARLLEAPAPPAEPSPHGEPAPERPRPWWRRLFGRNAPRTR